MSTLVTPSAVGSILTILGLVLLVIAVLLGFACLVYAALVFRTEWQCRGVPTPTRRSFFYGNAREFVEKREKIGLSTTLVVYHMTRDLGPVFWIRILWRAHFMVAAPEVVKELLLNSRHTKPFKFYRIFQSLYGARFMGHGLISELDHEKWFHRRAIMNPAFRRKYLMGMMEQFNEGSEALCQQLIGRADGRTEVAMLDEFNNTTLDLIAKISFSMNTEATSNPNCPFPTAVTTALKGMQKMLDSPLNPIDPRSKARKFRQSVRDAVGLVRETGRKCITERIDARQRGDYVPSDILNNILTRSDDLKGDEEFKMINMLDEFVTLFVAGQETTSNLLGFTLQQLGRYPDVAKRVQAEIDEVLGQKPFIQYEDLVKLEYMMRVLKETLRLYPPVVGTTRVTAHPIKYRDITIPAGMTTSVLTGVIGRMEEHFDDPLLFNPDRFKKSGDEELPKYLYAYFPFSMGQRSCIGQQFALIEARVILGKLLQRFEFHFNQSQRLCVLDELTSKPMDKCKNYITLRA